MSNAKLPVAVIGAGPVGLAAAAHLIERGETPIIFEAGSQVGASMREWSHVRMFSPWEFTVDQATVRLLESYGWQMPPKDQLPTGGDMADLYLQPFAALPEVTPHLHLNARVVAVSRKNVDKMKDAGREDAPFVLHIAYTDGGESLIEARAVIDASGTWQQPNPMGANGMPAVGEKRFIDKIAYGIPDVLGKDCSRYANKRVMVVGSGHSALNALLALASLAETNPQTEIFWAMRGDNLRRVYGGGTDDALPARGQLGTRMQEAVESGVVKIVSPFRIQELAQADSALNVIGETNTGLQTMQVDEVIVATGARPQLDMLRELRLDMDPSLESTRQLAPVIDPNIHSCGTVPPHGESELRQPEKNFYIVGMKSYGRAPTFLLATGYEQVRSVVAALVGDWEAARDVRLNLPETGVCSTDLGDGGSCCAPSTQSVVLSLDSIPVGGIPVSASNGVTLQSINLQPIPVALDAGGQCCGDNCCVEPIPVALDAGGQCCDDNCCN